MILGIGTDLVAVARVAAVLKRHPQRFVRRVLADSERAAFDASHDPARHLAKRFAAKEAAAKALGTGIGSGVGWHDLQISHDPLGCPQLVVSAAACQRVLSGREIRTQLSVSDEADYALAFVIIETAVGDPSQA